MFAARCAGVRPAKYSALDGILVDTGAEGVGVDGVELLPPPSVLEDVGLVAPFLKTLTMASLRKRCQGGVAEIHCCARGRQVK